MPEAYKRRPPGEKSDETPNDTSDTPKRKGKAGRPYVKTSDSSSKTHSDEDDRKLVNKLKEEKVSN